VEGEETSQHYFVFPGTYLCRFDQSVSVVETKAVAAPD
jgi:hypothetical protein